ncbi:MAG TPA: insulinase family protein, partial [Candidatus Wallbacteria bacterium]|nr:insulinase family protein [Candidatus Wallbacteria bacterium]
YTFHCVDYDDNEKNKIVESISCANWNFASSGAFVAFMIMDLKNFEKARELFFSEIENVKKGAITDEELIKAKNQIETAFVLAHQNYEGMAEFLGETVTISNVEKYNTFMESINKVKKEDVIACANKYLKPESHLIVVIEPKKTEKKTEVGKLEKK